MTLHVVRMALAFEYDTQRGILSVENLLDLPNLRISPLLIPPLPQPRRQRIVG
jgi:hypothetical protein